MRRRMRLALPLLLALGASAQGCVLIGSVVVTGTTAGATAGSAVPAVAAAIDRAAPAAIPPGSAVRVVFSRPREVSATDPGGGIRPLGRVLAILGQATRHAGDSLWLAPARVTGAHGRTRTVAAGDGGEVLVVADADVRLQVLARQSATRERNVILGAALGALLAAAALAFLLAESNWD